MDEADYELRRRLRRLAEAEGARLAACFVDSGDQPGEETYLITIVFDDPDPMVDPEQWQEITAAFREH
jgi:hypothetical protein